MKRFMLTMNMPGMSGNLVHHIYCDVEAKDCDDFCDLLNDNDFIVVQQYYRSVEGGTQNVTFLDRGRLVINTAHVGKVQEYKDREGDDIAPPRDFRRPPRSL